MPTSYYSLHGTGRYCGQSQAMTRFRGHPVYDRVTGQQRKNMTGGLSRGEICPDTTASECRSVLSSWDVYNLPLMHVARCLGLYTAWPIDNRRAELSSPARSATAVSWSSRHAHIRQTDTKRGGKRTNGWSCRRA